MFKRLLHEKMIENFDTKEHLNEVKKEKKIFDVITKEPVEKTNIPDDIKKYKNIKLNIAIYLHKEFKLLMKRIMSRYGFPKELRNEMSELFLPLGEVPEFLNKTYAKEVASIYSLFRKYIEVKKNIIQKEIEYEKKEFPFSRIKVLIGSGKNLEYISKATGIPKSTIAYKLKKLYNTSYTKLKQEMNVK